MNQQKGVAKRLFARVPLVRSQLSELVFAFLRPTTQRDATERG